MENLFAQIEQRYRFKLPEPFKEFWRRGFCTLLGRGRPGPHYIHLYDMEWMPLKEIAGFEFQSYHKPGVVPFAFTAGADYWCWQPEYTDDRGTRVLCCYRDSEDAMVYAPDFLSAVYRHAVEAASELYSDQEQAEQCQRDLISAAALLAPFIPPRWRQTLDKLGHLRVLTGPPRGKGGITDYFLISSVECRDMLTNDIACAGVNSMVPWMKEQQ